jgi:signal transduction histidine kinase
LRQLAGAAHDFGEGQLERRVEIVGTGELQEVSTAFNEMAERITDQIEGQRRLLAEVSHELRTPLGHLRLIVEIMRDSGPSAERLDKLEREIEAMDDLVDQLLAGARLDFDLERAGRVDAVDIAVTAAERVGKPELLDVGEGVADAVVFGDAALLTRALSNLVNNAETHGEGLTRLAVHTEGDVVRFVVEDAGPGVESGPDSDEPFAAFIRGENGKNGGESGLGLGLSLVRRIVQAHDGVVRFEPADEGARVAIELPRRPTAQAV